MFGFFRHQARSRSCILRPSGAPLHHSWPQSRHPMLTLTLALQRDLAPFERAGSVPISSQRTSEPAAALPGSSKTGQESHAGSSDHIPVSRGPHECCASPRRVPPAAVHRSTSTHRGRYSGGGPMQTISWTQVCQDTYELATFPAEADWAETLTCGLRPGVTCRRPSPAVVWV